MVIPDPSSRAGSMSSRTGRGCSAAYLIGSAVDEEPPMSLRDAFRDGQPEVVRLLLDALDRVVQGPKLQEKAERSRGSGIWKPRELHESEWRLVS